MEWRQGERTSVKRAMEGYQGSQNHLGSMFSMSWRGPFEGFSVVRTPESQKETAFSPMEMRWRGPFEGIR